MSVEYVKARGFPSRLTRILFGVVIILLAIKLTVVTGRESKLTDDIIIALDKRVAIWLTLFIQNLVLITYACT